MTAFSTQLHEQVVPSDLVVPQNCWYLQNDNQTGIDVIKFGYCLSKVSRSGQTFLEDSLLVGHLAQSRSKSRRKWASVIKRSLDIVVSVTLLILTAPLVLLAMLAIVATSRGPVFYLGQRCGAGENQFACFKLRTMYVNQDALLKEKGLSNVGDAGRLLVFEEDPRIGKVGRCLRKFSIDEIPQLLNVLKGDMSLIGPRPLPISMLQDYPEIRALRSVVRPGISGLWQVRNRKKNASVLDMVDDDLEYIRNLSFGLDLRIALATIPRIIEPSRRDLRASTGS